MEPFIILTLGFVFIGAMVIVVIKILQQKQQNKQASPSTEEMIQRRAFLNTEVEMNPEEKKVMMGQMIRAMLFIALIAVTFILYNMLSYWTFAVQGGTSTAKITKILAHSTSAGGRGGSTLYRYTLESTINGQYVKDDYQAQSNLYKVGDVVEVYFTHTNPPQLAIKKIESGDLFYSFLILLPALFLEYFFFRDYKKYSTGKVKIALLPKKFQDKRLSEK